MKNHREDSRSERVTNSTSAASEAISPPGEKAKKSKNIGIVTNCTNLNIRVEADPDAHIVAVIPALTEVLIDSDASTNDFYKVCTAAGIEGFCMRKYIAPRR